MKDENNMSKNLYYIYIDTRILGAVKQLLSYFQSDVFNTDACIAIYVKYYKENNEIISKLFDTHDISYKFIRKYSDISFDDGKVVFYLFNAQSNCRMVAFRNVSHVFITHGESNKKSSVKPITRIYDHVVTSGQVGIDRYLKAGIFTKSDIEGNRVIRLGNTFVGQNSYSYDESSRTLLYAPTWEGGVPDENFSSITENLDKLLVKITKNRDIKKIIIQTHPNLGHRDESYIALLDSMLSKLIKSGLKVLVIKNKVSIRDRLRAIYTGFAYVSSNKTIKISYAITDISAMEVQLLVKNIPTTVLVNRYCYEDLVIPSRMSIYYLDNMIYLNEDHDIWTQSSNPQAIISYIESYEEGSLRKLSFRKRVEWLCEYVNKNRVLQFKRRESI